MPHSRDGLGLWLPGPPFGNVLVIATLSILLSIISSGKMGKHVKACFSSTVSAFQSLVLAASSVVRSVLYACWKHSTSRPFGSPWIRIRRILKPCARGYHTIPHRCEKQQQHLSTSPSHHVVALSSSQKRFSWFATHFQP